MEQEVLAIEEKKSRVRLEYSSLSDEEIWRLRDEGDKGVVDWLFQKHSKLVFFKLNRRYFKHKFESRYGKDLEQEGFLGLLEAIKNYDPTIGSSFATYADYWIRCYFNRFLSRESTLITLPPYLQRLTFQVSSVLTKHMALENKMLDSEKLSEITGFTVSTINRARSLASYVRNGELSLDAPISDHSDEERTLMDVLSVTDGSFSEFENQNFNEVFLDLFETRFWLYYSWKNKERDLDMFKLKFGLNTGEGALTPDKIGEIYGVSRGRVRQIVDRVIDFIKGSGVLMDLIRGL